MTGDISWCLRPCKWAGPTVRRTSAQSRRQGGICCRRFWLSPWRGGLDTPHPFEGYAMPDGGDIKGMSRPRARAGLDLAALAQVFVDDFVLGAAGRVGRKDREGELLWIARAAMHAMHALFPRPEILGHDGGKDSISEKKLKRGDARFEPTKEVLGVLVSGKPGAGRVVSLPEDKADKCRSSVRDALASPAHRVSLGTHQKVLGKLVCASHVLPAMKGFFTPLCRELGGRQPGDSTSL